MTIKLNGGPSQVTEFFKLLTNSKYKYSSSFISVCKHNSKKDVVIYINFDSTDRVLHTSGPKVDAISFKKFKSNTLLYLL